MCRVFNKFPCKTHALCTRFAGGTGPAAFSASEGRETQPPGTRTHTCTLEQQHFEELTCSLHFSSCVYWHWPSSYLVRANSSSGQNPHRYALHTSLSVNERFGLRE